jgi:hypothetical protein
MKALLRETVRYWHPDAVATRMLRWAARWHHPFEIGDQTGIVLCIHCTRRNKAVYWPCEERLRLERKLTRLERKPRS